MAAEPAPLYSVLDKNKRMFEVDNFEKDNSGGKPLVYQNPQAMYYRPSAEKVYQANPAVFTAGDIKTQGAVVIKITQGMIKKGYYEHMMLQLTYNNTDGANSVTLAPAPYQLQTNGPAISVAFNNSAAPQCFILADALYHQLQHLSPSQLANVLAFNQMNMTSAAYQAPTAIAAGATAYYNIPLFLSPLIGMNSATITQDVTFTINFNTTNAVVGGTGTASLVGVSLLITTHENKVVDGPRASLISNSVYIKNWCNWYGTTYPSVPMQAGQASMIPLVGLTPCVAGGMLILIRSSKTTTSVYDFKSLAGANGSEATALIDLKDNTQTSLLGQGAITGLVSRSTLQLLESQGNMSNVVAAYWIYFSSRPADFIRSGDTSNGCLRLGLNNTLYLTPSAGSNFSTANYIVDVLTLQQYKLREVNGVIDVFSS